MLSLLKSENPHFTETMKRFDHSLGDYFQTTVKYRTRVRKGTILIIDVDSSLHDFLTELMKRCDLPIRVIHTDTVESAKEVVIKLGPKEIKVVVVNSNLLECNDASFAKWLNVKFPEIPLWLSECPEGSDVLFRDEIARIGILKRGEPLSDYVDILGFPEVCKSMAMKMTATA